MKLTKLAVPSLGEKVRPEPKRIEPQNRYRVSSSLSPGASPLAVCGQKLVAESVAQVRPVRFEEFEMPENVNSTLPTPSQTPSRLFTATRSLRRGPTTRSESIIPDSEVMRARRMFSSLEGKRRPIEWDRSTWKRGGDDQGVFGELFTDLF